jgi:AbrB family looped-hinge helix DNA binding protein
MPLAKLSSKSQIVIPAKIRRQLDIKPGDQLELSTEDNVILIRKSPQSAVDALDSCSSNIWCDYEKDLDNERELWSV